MFPTMSDEGRQWVTDRFERVGLIALGRRSYHDMATAWAKLTLPMAAHMNGIPKAVFSRSGQISPFPDDAEVAESWRHPIVGGTDLVADIQRLKAEDGKAILAIGGAAFAASLVAADLVDEYSLAMHPTAIGSGISFFAGLESPRRLHLEDVRRYPTGALGLTYRRLPA